MHCEDLSMSINNNARKSRKKPLKFIENKLEIIILSKRKTQNFKQHKKTNSRLKSETI